MCLPYCTTNPFCLQFHFHTVGLIQLNQDGTPILDPATGNPLETYTNEDIESLARAWTGFDRSPARSNIEGGTSQSDLDPLRIVPNWRDAFPKSGLNGGFIGDGFPLCEDLLLERSFLKKGARYRLLGGKSSPELMRDPAAFAKATNSILRAELDPSSRLYGLLHNGGDHKLAVELDDDLECHGIECRVNALRVVKVGAVYYEFVERPCVQMAFYEGGKKIQLRDSFRKFGQQCANPKLAHARESCCRRDRYDEVKMAMMESGVTYLYEAERMTYDTARERCIDYGKDLCVFRSVSASPNDDDFRKGYHWTNQDCMILMKVNPDGHVAIVHDIDTFDNDATPYHLDVKHTVNWFRVFWDGDGDYPGSSDANSCSANKCLTMDDGSCLCQTQVVEGVVFSGNDVGSISKKDIMSQLFIGAFGPSSGSVPVSGGNDLIVHIVGDTMDENTVFEVQDKGRTLHLKNLRSTVKLGEGWDAPPIYHEAEHASSIVNATVGSKNLLTFVELDSYESDIEWSVTIAKANTYMVSFRYALEGPPNPLRLFVNGDEVQREPTNPTIEIVDVSQRENLNLQRCESCNEDPLDECATGLFCVTRSRNTAEREVPGCQLGGVDNSLNYCADPNDYVHGVLFRPTGNGSSDWMYTEPIRVGLLEGENKIRVKVPPSHRSGPNIDHMKIEADPLFTAIAPPTAASFRNPPHFTSKQKTGPVFFLNGLNSMILTFP